MCGFRWVAIGAPGARGHQPHYRRLIGLSPITYLARRGESESGNLSLTIQRANRLTRC
jgi:hypothetical protein